MSKLIIVFLFFYSFLNASYIKKVEILTVEDKNLSINSIKDSKKFKRTKFPIIRHGKNDFFLRLTFDKSKLDDTPKVIELDNGFNYITLEDNISISKVYENKTLELSKDKFIETLYIKITNEDGYVNTHVKVYEKDEYIKTQIMITRLYGIAYGILIAAVLYYFALYLFNRESSYIFYSLTQISMLAILMTAGSREFAGDREIMDIIFFFFFIFSNFFTKSFLNTKVNAPRMHLLLNLTIAIYFMDILSGYIFGYYFFEENLPLSTLLIVYLISAVIIYLKGYKPALFYLIGWSLVILSFLFIEIQFYFTEEQLLIRPIYLMHIVTPMESLVLAFALAYKMKVLEEEKLEQQQFLAHQSKLASMGEMIGNIAHQWRQPLTHLSYIMMNLKTAFLKEKLSEEYFNKKTKEANIQLEFMSDTIDDFREFFNVTKQKEEFSLNSSIDEVINLLSASFSAHNIKVEFSEYKNINININIKSLKGEFMHVLFNILNNAKDEFISKNIENPKVKICMKEEKNHIKIDISDNAGGISTKVIDKIFEPYFTTKDKGLGIGLYMSKMIMDKSLNGKLEVSNIENGAMFTIKV